jgi:hypothetical protein
MKENQSLALIAIITCVLWIICYFFKLDMHIITVWAIMIPVYEITVFFKNTLSGKKSNYGVELACLGALVTIQYVIIPFVEKVLSVVYVKG